MKEKLCDWEKPKVIKNNKEDGHVTAMPHENLEEALRGSESVHSHTVKTKELKV